ncbi:MAG: CNNM domain-containing protein [Bacteroidota bacterium]
MGIAFFITQSGIFSGLDLAFFSLTRLRLEIEAEASPKSGAGKVLEMHRDSNFLMIKDFVIFFPKTNIFVHKI